MTLGRGPSPFLVALMSLAFVSLGLPDGLLGVAWPSIRSTFGLPLDALGALLVAFTSGYVASGFAGGWALHRLGLGRLLAASTALTAASLLGYAGAASWSGMVPLAALAGVGAGAIDTGVNAYASLYLGPRLMNWLHACYGVGAGAGPLLMTAVLQAGRPWRHGYAAVGLAQLLLAGAFALSAAAWATPPANRAPAPAQAPPAPPSSNGERNRASWLGALTFFLYTGLEAGIGVWSYTLLTEGRGVGPALAGAGVSGFWCGLTGGRLLGALSIESTSVPRLLRGCLLAIAAAAALLVADVSSGASLAAIVLAGLACGPVFPSLMSTTPERVGHERAARTVGLQIAAAALGAAALPAAVGAVAARAGIESVGSTLFGLSLAVLVAQEVTLLPVRAARGRAVPGARLP
jgi:fucose permease